MSSVELIHDRCCPNEAEARARPRRRATFWLASAPALLVALLPKLACPLCWPVYAALLAALGLGFLAEPQYLLPVTAVTFTLLLAALAIGAGSRRRALALTSLGALGTGAVLYGKFAIGSDALVYGGAVGLFAACVLKVLRTSASSCCTSWEKGERS